MNEREALEIIEKQIACLKETQKECDKYDCCEGCRHSIEQWERQSALAVAAAALRAQQEARSSDDLDSMPLDDAINHCQEDAVRLREEGCDACAREHEQLAKWLSELAVRRAQQEAMRHDD